MDSAFSETPDVWDVRCWCGEAIVMGTDLDGGLLEWCSRGHESKTTTQRKRK